MIAREVPIARLVDGPADGDPEIGSLHQGEGAHHLAPHAVDGGRRERTLMLGQPLAHDLRLTAGSQRQAGRFGCRNPIHQGGATLDEPVQFTVYGVDFLPQEVEIGRVHKPGVPVRERRYYVRTTPVKPRNLRALAQNRRAPYRSYSVEFEPTGLRPR